MGVFIECWLRFLEVKMAAVRGLGDGLCVCYVCFVLRLLCSSGGCVCDVVQQGRKSDAVGAGT